MSSKSDFCNILSLHPNLMVRSIFENTVAPFNSSNNSSITGTENLSGAVTLLGADNPRKIASSHLSFLLVAQGLKTDWYYIE